MAQNIKTEEEFNRLLEENSNVIIDFYADWCGPCRIMEPIMEEIANDYDGKYIIRKINVDEIPHIASEFLVTSIPTFIFFKDGKEVYRAIGVKSKGNILEYIEKYFA